MISNYIFYNFGTFLKVIYSVMLRFNILGIQDRKDQLEKTRLLLAELPSCNRTLLAWLFTHMSHVIEKVCWLSQCRLQMITVNPTTILLTILAVLFLSWLVFIEQNESTEHWNSSQSHNEYWTWHIVHLPKLCQWTLP